MARPQCKYTNEQLRRMVAERGLENIIDEIDPTAIADTEVRVRWQRIYDALDELQEMLA